MSAPTIVFDLDGTLIDTAPDLVQTLNVIFAREGLAPLPFEAGRNFVGGGAKAMIVRALEAERRVFPPARIERMFEEFIAHYRDHVAERSRPFPGLADALDALAARIVVLRYVPTSLSIFPCSCLIDLDSLIASLRFVGKTHLAFRSRTRRFCGELWPPHAERCSKP
jgi:Haloacid dehalogenase-like hydrolase